MQQGNFIDVFLAQLPCCIKLAFHIISRGRCTVKQPSSSTETFVSINNTTHFHTAKGCNPKPTSNLEHKIEQLQNARLQIIG